ncbi:MAG: hypothetical protein HT580_12710 [Dechloromonas sp.]|nr:MAG: hypothetical protein HT580_12710 [Dechloromonas sp.]
MTFSSARRSCAPFTGKDAERNGELIGAGILNDEVVLDAQFLQFARLLVRFRLARQRRHEDPPTGAFGGHRPALDADSGKLFGQRRRQSVRLLGRQTIPGQAEFLGLGVALRGVRPVAPLRWRLVAAGDDADTLGHQLLIDAPGIRIARTAENSFGEGVEQQIDENEDKNQGFQVLNPPSAGASAIR